MQSATFQVAVHAIFFAVLALFITGSVRAGGVIECNSCASPSAAAIRSGPGLTVIVDFENVQLTAFNVEYDDAQGRWRADATPVPAQIQAAFLRVVESTLPDTDLLYQQMPDDPRDGARP
ncbi:hypothetical protein [Stenotrophomonas sp.]|uniref:hypothetical protein n=1 Tax=Stenotrophomonas sp. TaxID=69392 RepID=UPI002D54F57C|nr:hypothetical protein [Stenotrophomonas sp.]HYQ24971.1 hypothetical protein [Stenotrophomonas sp.]